MPATSLTGGGTARGRGFKPATMSSASRLRLRAVVAGHDRGRLARRAGEAGQWARDRVAGASCGGSGARVGRERAVRARRVTQRIADLRAGRGLARDVRARSSRRVGAGHRRRAAASATGGVAFFGARAPTRRASTRQTEVARADQRCAGAARCRWTRRRRSRAGCWPVRCTRRGPSPARSSRFTLNGTAHRHGTRRAGQRGAAPRGDVQLDRCEERRARR